MERVNDELRAALDAVAAGRLDALSPEQVARLEEYVNADPAAAARLEAMTPAVEPVLRQSVAMPVQADWELVWDRVEAATTAKRHVATRTRILRLWTPLVAAAACAVAALVWDLNRHPAASDWPVEWSHSVEVDDLEVAGGTTPFVLAGGSDTISVIWVLDAEG